MEIDGFLILRKEVLPALAGIFRAGRWTKTDLRRVLLGAIRDNGRVVHEQDIPSGHLQIIRAFVRAAAQDVDFGLVWGRDRVGAAIMSNDGVKQAVFLVSVNDAHASAAASQAAARNRRTP